MITSNIQNIPNLHIIIRCWHEDGIKVLDKMTGLGDQGGGLVLENICGNTCIWAEMIQSVRYDERT